MIVQQPDTHNSVLARYIPKGTVPFVASTVAFGIWLKPHCVLWDMAQTTLCRLGCSNYLNYLKVLTRLNRCKTADKSDMINIE